MTTLNRRQFMIAGTSTLAAASLGRAAIGNTTDKSSVTIVVVGAGLAGLSAINRLKKSLPNAKLILVDANQIHRYQPGYTLLATGVWHSVDKVINSNQSIIPSGVEWVLSNAKEFQPEQNRVITDSGQVVNYDYLIIATGLRLGYEKIEGLTVGDLGKNGIGSVYASPEIALATWSQMHAFCQTGGNDFGAYPNEMRWCTS